MPNLKRLLTSGHLRRLQPGSSEIVDLLKVVERDLSDARVEQLSIDRRFATAYNAALQLATAVLRAEGYRTQGVGHHRTTIIALPLILGSDVADTAYYLDACRSRRNTVDYDGVGVATEAEVGELIREVEALRSEVVAWLDEQHPELS